MVVQTGCIERFALEAETLRQLEQSARALNDKNHQRFMAEALACLLRESDPVAALRLLRAMWGTSHAGRPQEKAALDAVGEWLDARLRREPRVRVERLAVELGWLRRLSRYYGKESGANSAPSASMGKEPRFGKFIEELARRRAWDPAQEPPKRPRPAPEEPISLPEWIAVHFEQIQVAREVRKTRREREKKGKPVKEVLVVLAPSDPAFTSLAAGLCCSSLHPGFDRVFERMERRGGQAVPFWVSRLEARGEKKVVGEIRLDDPAE